MAKGEIQMNLQQLKAKYAGTTATTAVQTVKTATTGFAEKAWETTKSATATTTSYIKDVAPATNRRVNSIASELNVQLNNHEKELFKQQIMIEMIAQSTGVNLPSDEVLEQYWESEQERIAAEAKAEAEKALPQETVDSMAAKVMEQVLAAFKKNGFAPKEEPKEKVESKLTPEQTKHLDELVASGKESEESVDTDDEADTVVAGTTKESRRKAANEKKKGEGRRRLGRQAPLAE
jgi:hypothetical protein